MARGSVRQVGENKWKVTITLDRDERGRYPQISRTIYGTRKTADDKARALLNEHAGRAKPGKTTMATLFEQWTAHIEARGRADSTVYNYRNKIRHDINPSIGKVDVRRLTVRHLDDLYTAIGKRQKGGSPSSVRQLHAIIHAALNYAVKRELVDRNVADHADPPELKPKKLTPPTPAEVMRILTIGYEMNADLGMALRLAATTGARRGSIVALRSSHVSFTDNHVIIERAMSSIPGRGLRDKELKAGRGGPVPLDAETMAMLADHMARLHARAAAAGTAMADDFYLFCLPNPKNRHRVDGSLPIDPSTLTDFFEKVRAKAKLPKVRLHDLRHFVPTTGMALGYDAVTMADRLKHASPKMTLDVYSHVVSDRARELGDALGQLLGGQQSAPQPEGG